MVGNNAYIGHTIEIAVRITILQAAINVASSGDTFQIQSGTYYKPQGKINLVHGSKGSIAFRTIARL